MANSGRLYRLEAANVNHAEDVMGRLALPDEIIPLLAERFKALAEPARLQLLRALMTREHTVNELVLSTQLSQANVSKHLQLLHTLGFVRRRKHGLFVHYAIADRQVAKLCDLMCARVLAETPRSRNGG
ncbi:metalloregulator ArsR/SmtB family transcription factor [Gemmatimonas sp.]|jgi:DNA-binding transcriptional ArsR family regulator|uniref:ArsR/SmtB family transcription factor n=1 Tax=Gemmatimonas sp. TaxID=1962908 RepID=UPI0022CCBDC4|nr:metalloregulator ArsR/SmtB family transcription factor [Gemmatimonas sp.]MCZ8206327.1 metalloregulator ArsR/SmtB family transcription factor [Gemmatimonas sp.]